MLSNISNKSYENVEEKQLIPEKNVLVKNIPRLIRVRNINKYKTDRDENNLDIEELKRFLEIRKKNQQILNEGQKNLSPPRLLKSHFRTKTNDMIHMITGKYVPIRKYYK